MAWQRPLIPESFEQQMLSDLEQVNAGMREIRIADGRTMRFFDCGAGQPIVFMPMIPELNFIYAPQIALFSQQYRTITYEPLLSRTTRIGIRDRAQQTLQLMDALEVDAAHIVAWSDAGSAAYDLARHAPARCKSLVLLGLPDKYRLPPPRQFLSNLLRFLPLEHVLPDVLVRRFLSHYLSGPCIPAPLISRYARRIPSLTRLFKHSALPNLYQHQPKHGEVHAPALVVAGELDTLVTIEQARRLARLMPNAREVVTIENGEHLLSFAQADAVNKAMEAFYCSLNICAARI